MKKIIVLYLFIIPTAALLVVACKKNKVDTTLRNSDFSTYARVQVMNAAVVAARNFITVDAQGINGTALAYGGVFPTSPNTSFAIPFGFKNFVIRDTSTTILTQPQLSFAENFDGGKYYTIFLYDTITAVKQKTVLTNIVIPTDTTARLRFANFIYNPTALPNGFDIYSVKRNAVIFTNVKETEVTDYIPYASNLNDTFYIRNTGSGTNIQNWIIATAVPSTVFASLNPSPKRSYTLIFRGGWRAIATTNATVRTLSTFINY